MKKYLSIISSLTILFILLAFFYKTLLFGKLPVPADALVGLYHPWRDLYAFQYPRGMPFKNFLITDPVRQQIPWRKLTVDGWKTGSLPSWNPTSFFGTPLASNSQSGAFYPLNILFLFLPFAAAWTLLIILQPTLGGLWMYLYLRERGRSAAGSAIGAIMFALSGTSIAWMTWGTIGHVVLWIPLALLAIDKIFAQETPRKKLFVWQAVITASIILQITAGHTQIALYSLLLQFAYIVRHAIGSRRTSGRTRLGHTVFASIVGLLVASPLLISTYNFASDAHRLTSGAMWRAEGFFIPIVHLVQFLVPDFFGNPSTLNYWGVWNYGEMVGYVGILGLLFAVMAAVQLRKKGYIRFWLVVIAVSLVGATKNPVSLVVYLANIPILSSLQPTRLLILIDLALAVLAAHGADWWRFGRTRRPVRWPWFIVGGIFVILWGLILFISSTTGDQTLRENLIVAKRNILLPTILFVVCLVALNAYHLPDKNKRRKGFWLVAMGFVLAGIFLFDIFRFGWKFIPFVDRQYFFPETKIISFLAKQPKPLRILAVDDRILPPNTSGFYGIESVGGYDPIHSGRYEEFITAMERNTPDIRPPFGFDRIIAPKNIDSFLFPILNVRYVLTFHELENSKFRKVMEEGESKLYEYADWLPRAYIAQNILYRKNRQEILDALYDRQHTIGLIAVVEQPVSILSLPVDTTESVNIRSYQPNEIYMDVRVNMPRLLIITNMFDTGWQATVDGARAKIYRTNYVFMGISLPAGSHTVRLYYR